MTCGPDTLGSEFTAPRFIIYRAICERLEMIDRVLDASNCFHQMVSELEGQTNTHDEQAKWVLGELRTLCRRYWCDCCLLDFRLRCHEKHECLGDVAADAQRLDEAITHYSAAMSLDISSPQGILIKRSKACMAKGLWEDALHDAKQVGHFCFPQIRSYRCRIIRPSHSIH